MNIKPIELWQMVTFRCKYCSKTFNSKVRLKQHINDKHNIIGV